MTVLLALAERELLMLTVLFAFGSGPCTFLPARFSPVSRLALAPVLGMCVGACVLTSALWFAPTSETPWLVPVVALGSLFVAARRWGPMMSEAGPGDAPSIAHVIARVLAVLAVVFIVTLPANYTMVQERSLGPVAYAVYDGPGYVAEIDAAQQWTIPDAHAFHEPYANAMTEYWNYSAAGDQQLDLVPLDANLASLVGLHASDVQVPFLVAVLAASVLAMIACVRAVLGRPSIAALLAGLLLGGSFFLQLFFDSSQAALCGLALVLPLFVVLGLVLGEGAPRRGIAIVALLGAGTMSYYPILVPPLGVVALFAVIFGLVRARNRHHPRAQVWHLASRLVGGACLACVLNPLATSRDFQYWWSLLTGGYLRSNYPVYNLGAGVVPSWIAQARGFYDVAFGPQSPLHDPWFTIGAPIVAAIVAIIGLRTSRLALVIGSIIPVCVAVAMYEVLRQNCSYCQDRNLLPIEPALIFLIGLGVGSLLTSRTTVKTAAAAVLASAVIVPAVLSTVHERTRYTNSFFLSSSLREVLRALPTTRAGLEIEGFNEGDRAPGELLATYEAAFEAVGDRASMLADSSEHAANAYFGVFRVPGPQFDPHYRYVLTRDPGITTRRRIIAEAGGVALESRAVPYDVTIDDGLVSPDRPIASPMLQQWIDGPLRLVVVGPRRRAYVRVQVAVPAAITPIGIPDATRQGGLVTVCAPTTGRGTIQRVTLPLTANIGIRITAMAASAVPCRSA